MEPSNCYAAVDSLLQCFSLVVYRLANNLLQSINFISSVSLSSSKHQWEKEDSNLCIKIKPKKLTKKIEMTEKKKKKILSLIYFDQIMFVFFKRPNEKRKRRLNELTKSKISSSLNLITKLIIYCKWIFIFFHLSIFTYKFSISFSQTKNRKLFFFLFHKYSIVPKSFAYSLDRFLPTLSSFKYIHR